MYIEANTIKVEAGEAPKPVATIMYKSSETLPGGYAEGSFAYCYDGADKGKTFIYDGTQWVEQ